MYIPEMFAKLPVTKKSVAVIGSATPLYEAYIEFFMAKPITIEYRRVKHTIPSLMTYTFNEAKKRIIDGSLVTDAAFCYSSIKHSGLGRYGDELDPSGDLETMKLIRKMVKPGGYIYLQIPIGNDLLIGTKNACMGSSAYYYSLKS